jgi:hypothetical protein
MRSKQVGRAVVVDDENVVETVVLVDDVVLVEDVVETVELVVVPGKSRKPRHTHPPATTAQLRPDRQTPLQAGNVCPHACTVGSQAHPTLSPSTTSLHALPGGHAPLQVGAVTPHGSRVVVVVGIAVVGVSVVVVAGSAPL